MAILPRAINKKKTRRNKTELIHYLPWSFYIKKERWVTSEIKDELCIIVHKDGCLQITFGFRGQDLDSCTPYYINGVAAQFNECVKRLGDGWAVSVEAQRFMSREYPQSSFNNLTAFLVDSERSEDFQSYGEHYDSSYYLTFVYKPEIEINRKLFGFFMVEAGYSKAMDKEINDFLKTVERMTGVLENKMIIRPLDCYETVAYLHSTVSMKRYPFILPDHFMFLDSFISDESLEIGQTCKLGDNYIPILVIQDFPMETYPSILHDLNKAEVEYRWSSRFFPLGKQEALKELDKWQARHHGNQKSNKQLIGELMFNVETSRVNQGAVAEQSDVEVAQQEVTTDLVGLGYYNSCIMVWDNDYDKAMAKLRVVMNIIESSGIRTKEETFGAFDAFLGLTAGDVYHNIRRPLVSTGNYAHALPLSAVWSGMRHNKHTNEICGVDAPLVTCSTNYGTQFFLNLNEGDVGHTLIFGPTGAGKSTLLQLLEISFLKYRNAQVFILDKGMSALTLTLAVGGDYINPSHDHMAFQPLAEIHDRTERVWAAEFIETLLEMQNVSVTAGMSISINTALEVMSSYPVGQRTLTSFRQVVQFIDPDTQRNTISEGITPYTLEGAYGDIFDGEKTTLNTSNWLMVEMEPLMEMKEKVVAPAIMCIFHLFEKRFDGRLTLLVLDEAWVFLDHPIFSVKMKEWLKVLRKKNVFCVFATQEVADAYKSNISSTLIQNCPTKIYLADPQALDLAEYYRKFGLTDDEIGILSMAVKKRDYYYKSVLGTRLFQLSLGKLTLALFRQQANVMRDKTGKEYRWSDYCQYLLEMKNTKNIRRGFVEEILEMQGIEYEKYLDGVAVDNLDN